MSTLDPIARDARSARPATSARPPERSGPPRPPEGKQSLRLKLEGDTYYEANVGRVRVPKRRGPMLLGVLVIFAMLVGGAWLWIDGHGGVTNFVAAVRHVIDPDSPDPGVQSSLTYGEPGAAQPPAATSGAQPNAAQPPATTPQQPPAAVPAAQPTAAPQQPAAAEPKPAEQPGQIATGEIEAPDEQPATGAKPANETGVKPEQPAEAKPKPKPQVAAKPKPRPPVRRDPVLKVQPLGDVLNAAPPDPSGAAVLPPPDPPAPE
jgi:pyruvate/2-oxoglutarate dehydrogenase complex dihydrolipoamide acyltransferase (E2) component